MNIVTDGSTFLKKQHKLPMKRSPGIIMSLVHRQTLPSQIHFAGA